MSSPAWFGIAGIGPTGVSHREKIPSYLIFNLFQKRGGGESVNKKKHYFLLYTSINSLNSLTFASNTANK